MRSIQYFVVVMMLAVVISPEAAGQKNQSDRDHLFQDRSYLGKPLTYWLQVIRDRDEEMISVAFDAVRSLGEDGWIAVPDLARVVEGHFAPIDIANDSQER